MVKVILAYIPVLHKGYIEFLNKHRDAERLYIFGENFIEEYEYLKKEIRALEPIAMLYAISALMSYGVIPSFEVYLLENFGIFEADDDVLTFVMPDEDVCRSFAENYLKGKKVEFDSIFLRWDRTNIHKLDIVKFDRQVEFGEFVAEAMNRAIVESEYASSWWRQVGGVIVKNGEIILSAHNEHMPTVHSVYACGDPRNAAHRGEDIELSTDCHAEQRLISEAARRGIALLDAELFVTTFPCPPCGMAIAYSGIKKLYFLEGYSMVGSVEILKNAEVEIIHVKQQI